MTYQKKVLGVCRALILFFTAFIGVGALVGSMMFFLDPQNGFVMDGILLSMQQKLPFAETLFSSLVFPGIALILVNGVTNLVAFFLILRRKRPGYLLGWLFGITLMLWISVQFYVFAPIVYPIDVVFFLLGLLQFVVGYLAYAYDRQLQFQFDPADYPRVGRGDHTSAVVYFSREGYAKKLAFQKANALGCDLIELKTPERTQGVPGFWWCGRFGMHQWEMPLAPIDADLAAYRTVYVFSPVWVFALCAPVRAFFTAYADHLQAVDLTVVHFMRGRLGFLFEEPKKLLGERLIAVHSVCCRFGVCRDADRAPGAAPEAARF